MTERKGEVRPPVPADPGAEMVVHKSTRDCPMIQPHPRAMCGIVQSRERAAREADAQRSGSKA